MSYSAKERLSTIFVLLLCAGIVGVSMYAMFVDEFAQKIGDFILIWQVVKLPNQLVIGKTVSFMWLIIAPTFLVVMPNVGSQNGFKTFLRVLGYLIVGGLLIYFYIYSKPWFATFVKEETKDWISRFLCDVKDLYIWYAIPVFFVIAPISIQILFSKIGDERPFLFLFLTILIIGIIAILLPLVTGFLGAILALVLGIGIVIGGLFFVGKVGEMIPPPTKKVYRLSDGTEITENGSGGYSDSSGTTYHTDDGGNTFYK